MLPGPMRFANTGSVSTRRPSISSTTVECPSHVARSPLSTDLAHDGRSTGSTSFGRRSWPPNTHSRSTSPRVPFHTPFFRPPVFRNRPS